MDQRNEKSNANSKPSLREVREILSKVKKAITLSSLSQDTVTEHASHPSRSSFVSLPLPSSVPTNLSLSSRNCSVMVDERSLLSNSPCLYPLSRKSDAKEESVNESEKDVSDVEKESAADLQPLIRVVSGMEEGPREEDSPKAKEEEGSASQENKETPSLSGNHS